MPKFNGGTKLAGFILSVAVILVTVTLSWADQKGDIKLLNSKIDTMLVSIDNLKEDGCKPSKINTTAVAVIEAKLKSN